MFNILILGITSLLTDISSEMVYPILPLYLVNTLGASPVIVGIIEGIAESLASALKVFSGFFSDKIKKRRPFAIFGYASSAFGKFFLYVSASWSYVLAGRIIDRLGKGIRTAPRDALIAESADGAKRGAAFGLHRAMDTLGATIGVIAAYFLVTRFQGDLKIVFLVSLIPAAGGVLFLFLVREKRATSVSQPRPVALRWSSLDKRLRFFLIFTFIFTLGNSSNQFLLLRAKQMGSSVQDVILMYLTYNLVFFLFAYPSARLSDKIGRKKILVLGYLCYGLVYFGFALNASLCNLWILFGAYGLYAGFTEGVEKALISDIAPVNLKATAIGLHATIVGIGLFPASFLAGILWKSLGPAAPFYFGGIIGVLASAGLWFVLRRL